jgi:hypothetical protein
MKIFVNGLIERINIGRAFQELDMLPKTLPAHRKRDKTWGTAHAVWVTRYMVNVPFAVI